MSDQNKIAVVILNYKVKDKTLRCIDSVKKSNYQDLQIIVVDNNSNDGLEEELTTDSKIIFIQTHNNLGYAGGNNIGIKKALNLEVDHVLILNPDCELKSDAIIKLLSGMTKNNASLAGPKILFDDKKTIWFAGGVFDKENVLGSHRGVDEKDSGQYNHSGEVDFISGAAIMLSRDILGTLGLFDERYFLYYEDLDLCYRAKSMNLKVMYIPDSVVFHDNASSTHVGSPLQDYFITRNRLLFASKHLSLRTQLALLREAIRNFSIPARRLALFDFIFGRFGKGSFIKD